MTILYVYAHKNDNEPIMVFSGCPWRGDCVEKKITVWDTPEGCYTFPAKQMNNTVNDMVFYAYGEIENED
jgi:hypothetical protein